MITYKDILQRMRDVLANDTALADWCQTNYGQAPKIFVGIDNRNQPGKKDCPLIILRPGTAEVGREVKNHEYKIMVDWAVLDESVSTNGSVVEYQGVFQIDDMGQLVWQALQGFSSNVSLSRNDYILEPIDYFPMIVGGMDLSISVPNLIGGGITL